jgi:methionyl-tRNA formyltransferase
MSKSLNIVFMGTPEFAVASLDALVNSRHKVTAVVTAPDKPASRGLKLHQSAVKEYALNHNIPVLQPQKLKDEEFINRLKELNPDLIAVVAFRMLPEVVWKMPPLGTINLHGSLLPQYRGAAPINWAVINGEKETGVTTFFINHVIDNGDILLNERIPIEDSDNAGTIHDKLMKIGSALLVKTLDLIGDGFAHSQAQEGISAEVLKPAPKIFRNDCRINWNQSAMQVHNLIRGLSSYPAAWTVLKNKAGAKQTLKIYASRVKPGLGLNPGELRVESNVHIYIGCHDEAIEIKELQLEGRKTMPVADFLRGFKLAEDGWGVDK